MELSPEPIFDLRRAQASDLSPLGSVIWSMVAPLLVKKAAFGAGSKAAKTKCRSQRGK